MTIKTTTRTMRGKVIQNSCSKTVAVLVVYSVKHSIGKYVKKHRKIQAHDESEIAKLGDTVVLEECRPISKTKSWRVVSVVDFGEKK